MGFLKVFSQRLREQGGHSRHSPCKVPAFSFFGDCVSRSHTFVVWASGRVVMLI